MNSMLNSNGSLRIDTNILLNSKLLCVKCMQFAQDQAEYINDIAEVMVSFRRQNNKLFAICKRSDLNHILDSKILIYKNDNIVKLLKKISSARCIQNRVDIIKVPIGGYAKKCNTSLARIREILALKNIIEDSNKIK